MTSFEADFGRTAEDYARHRAGFPPELFDRLAEHGLGGEGRSVLDIGTGTGTLARGFAELGAAVTGLDRSAEMVESAKELDAEAGVSVTYAVGTAEETGLPDKAFDLVIAGQCWHWFHGPSAFREAERVMAPGGALVICHFDWLPLPGNMVEATETLIRSHNAEWPLWGGTGFYPQWATGAAVAGYRDIETFTFDVSQPYTHEAWRGRIRASAGVGGSLSPEEVGVFDASLAGILADQFPEDPMIVPHRVFALIAHPPAD